MNNRSINRRLKVLEEEIARISAYVQAIYNQQNAIPINDINFERTMASGHLVLWNKLGNIRMGSD